MYETMIQEQMREPLSVERKEYIKKVRNEKRRIRTAQWLVLVGFVVMWEFLAQVGIVDAFIMSQPSRILNTIWNMLQEDLLYHIGITVYETLAGFLLGVVSGVILATIFWWSDTVAKIAEPYLVVLNSLPKIALGPVIIIWVGAGQKAIIFMALAISLIVTVLEMLNGFLSTPQELMIMAKTLGATKMQIFQKIVLPSNTHTLFSSLKINIGLSLVGVIAGEFLVSKGGLGYLIVYGGQVFKMDLVMTGVLLLSLMAALMYQMVLWLERFVEKRMSHNETW